MATRLGEGAQHHLWSLLYKSLCSCVTLLPPFPESAAFRNFLGRCALGLALDRNGPLLQARVLIKPREPFDREDLGHLNPGARADLVVVEGDPSIDITATRRVRAVWFAGEGVNLESAWDSVADAFERAVAELPEAG